MMVYRLNGVSKTAAGLSPDLGELRRMFHAVLLLSVMCSIAAIVISGRARLTAFSLCVGRKRGISFYNPQLEGWSTHYIPLEAAVKDCCRLLLYVISEDTRAMTSMIEVRQSVTAVTDHHM